jgi:hypothetical protein
MAYYLIFGIAFIILIGTSGTTFLFWDDAGFQSRLMLILLNIGSVYSVFDLVRRYSKIKLANNQIRIKRFFSSTTVTLNKLISWKVYSSRFFSPKRFFDRIFLEFEDESITISDLADPEGFEVVFHHLRVNYTELNQDTQKDSNTT